MRPKDIYSRAKYRLKKKPASFADLPRKELIRRIEEVMTRFYGKVPDKFMSEGKDFMYYKKWVTEPFLYMKYEKYNDSNEI